jgi:hypothetical protein
MLPLLGKSQNQQKLLLLGTLGDNSTAPMESIDKLIH